VAGTYGYGEELVSITGSINAGNFLTSCKVYWLASQEGLCSMEYVSIYNFNRNCTSDIKTNVCLLQIIHFCIF
jgi:hypothetical protein